MSNNFANLIGVLGAAMGGYTQGKRQSEHDALDKKEREQAQELRGIQVSEAKQRQQDAADLRDAAKPIPVQQNAPGDGMGPTAFLGGGDSFGTQQSADQALNSPKAVMGRQRIVLDRTDPAGAPVRMKTDIDLQLGQLGLDKAHQDDIKRKFQDSLNHVTDHKGLGELISTSTNDGMGGTFKVQVVPSADGKRVQYRQIAADGRVASTGQEFSNDAKGLVDAKIFLAGVTPLADQISHLHQGNQEQLAKDKQASEERYRAGLLDISQKKVDIKEASDTDKMPEADKLRYVNLGNQLLKIQDALLKGRSQPDWDEGSSGAKALRESQEIVARQYQQLSDRYTQKAAKPYDPLGIRGGAQGPTTGLTINGVMLNKNELDAGPTTLQIQYGGDVGKAKADVASIMNGISKAPTPETKTVLQTQLRATLAAIASASSNSRQTSGPTMSAKSSKLTPLPSKLMSTSDILAAPTKGDAVLDKLAADKAVPIDKAISAYKTALALFRAAAKSQDPKAVAAYQRPLQLAQAAMDATLKDVPDAQRKSILVGVDD